MNDLQVLALVVCLEQDQQNKHATEWQAFKYQAIAAHPENTEKILALGDETQEIDSNALATPLSDEEMRNYVPLSVEEIGEAASLLAGFGLRMEAPE